MYENEWTIAKNEEVRKILDDPIFYDNGIEEVVISRKDIAKAIAATPVHINARIFEIVNGDSKEIATTLGFFLDWVDPVWRIQNINELVKYQYRFEEVGTIFYLPEFPESEYDKLIVGKV